MLRLLVPCLLAMPALAQLSTTVAIYPLDATSGTAVTDAGPLGNHGLLVNFGAAPWVAGHTGNALQFDGVDDYVQITAASGLPIYSTRGAPFSIAFWVKAPPQSDRRVWSEQAAAPSGNGPLFTLGSGSTAAVATNRLRVYIRTDNNIVSVDQLSNATVFDDTWHHVVYVDEIGRVRLYVDGVLDSTFDYSRWSYGPAGTLQGSYQQINSLTLGAVVRNSAVAAPLGGALDDVQVFRAALDAGDVTAVHGGGAPNLVAGALGEYGRGCGPGPLDMVATGRAAFNDIVWLQATRGTPGGNLLLGFSAGLVTPTDLTPNGYPGCTLYLPAVSTLGVGTIGPSGSSQPIPIPIPNTMALNGLFFVAQWFSLLSGTVEFSPAAVAQVGR